MLRELLGAKEQELRRELRDELFAKMGEDYSTRFEQAVDIGDRSLLDVVESIGGKLIDIRQTELTQLAEAQHKLAEGTYGVCEDCDAKIPLERLKAVPFATRCTPCAEMFEAHPVHGTRPTI